MEFKEIIGWAGLILLLASWVPQTWQTVKAGRTDMAWGFLILYVVSSFLLTVYAVMNDDVIFIILNGLLTVGGGINLTYKIKPRS